MRQASVRSCVGAAPALTRLAASVILGLVFFAAAGCEARVLRTVHRFIDEDPHRLPDIDSFAQKETEVWCDFAQPGALDRWLLFNLEFVGTGDPGVVLRATTEDPKMLASQLKIDAAEVDAIEVELKGPQKGRLQLFWAAAGEELSRERRLEVAASDGRDRVYTFTVAGHPHWSGRIARLRLDPTTVAGRKVTPSRISFIHYRGSEHEIDAALRGRG